MAALREYVIGSVARPLAPDEMSWMKQLAGQPLRDGASGMSTGLGYAPGIYSDTNELVELSRVLAKHNALYTSQHQRRCRDVAAGHRGGYRNRKTEWSGRPDLAHGGPLPRLGSQGIPLRLIEEARAEIAAFTAVATCSPFPGTRRLCQIDPHQRRSVCWRPESSWARAFSGGLPGFMSSSVLAFCGHGAV